MSELPTSAQAAERIGWTLTRFNRKLDNVCDKLDRIGVPGMRGGARVASTPRNASRCPADLPARRTRSQRAGHPREACRSLDRSNLPAQVISYRPTGPASGLRARLTGRPTRATRPAALRQSDRLPARRSAPGVEEVAAAVAEHLDDDAAAVQLGDRARLLVDVAAERVHVRDDEHVAAARACRTAARGAPPTTRASRARDAGTPRSARRSA